MLCKPAEKLVSVAPDSFCMELTSDDLIRAVVLWGLDCFFAEQIGSSDLYLLRRQMQEIHEGELTCP